MSVGKLVFKTHPTPKAQARALNIAAKKFEDYRPAWRKLLPNLAQEMGIIVNSRGRALEGRWPPLSTKTIKQKKHDTPFVRTGKTLSDLTTPRKGKRKLTRKMIAYGPTERFAYVFHYGVDKRQPSRTLIGWTENLRGKADEFISDRAQELIDEAIRAGFTPKPKSGG